MIKLIVPDMGGTLVQDGSPSANPQVLDTILKLREKGIQFVIASGRPWTSVGRTFEPVKEKILYAANNGAYVGCCGRSLYVYSIEPEIVYRIIKKVCRHPDLEVVYAGTSGDYVEPPNEELSGWLTESYRFDPTRVDDLPELDEPCVKVSVYKPKGIETATKDIYKELKDELGVACADDMWMDCMAKGMNKREAIETIQDSLGIKPEETMAFSDQLNDIKMLDRAYYSFTVAGIRKEVGKVARSQADSNKNDGILKILRYLLWKEFFIGRE